MPIIVNLDVMMAKRHMGAGELAETIGITPANLSILKNNKAKAVRFSTLEALCKALCCLPLEHFCVDAQLARPDCDWQLLQRYTWQSSELDEYITQQAGENANLSGRGPSILRCTQDRSVACTPHWGVHC